MLPRRGLLAVGGVATLIYTIFVATASATTYHPNIYSVLPLTGWIVFGLALITGVLALYSSVRAQSQHDVARSLIQIATTYLVFWFYPIQIGLRFWTAPRGDLLMHFGKAKAILATGHVPGIDIYPLPHILIAQLYQVTSIPIGVFGPLLSLVYYSLFIAGIIFVARRYGSPRTASYVLIATTPLVFNKYTHSFMPWMMTFALIPLVFVFNDLWIRSISKGQRMAALTGALAILWFIIIGHPMTGLVLFTVIVGIEFIRAVGTHWINGERIQPSPVSWGGIVLLGYPVWYLSQVSFTNKIAAIAVALTGTAPGQATQKLSRARNSGYGLIGLAEYVIGNWGTLLLYLSVAGAIWLGVAYRVIRRRASTKEVVLTGLFAFGASIAVVLLAGNFITGAPYRVNQVTLTVSFFVIGGGLYWLSEHDDGLRYRIPRVLLVTVIVGAVVWGPFTIYSEDAHVVETEFEGADHLLEYRDESQQVKSSKMANVLAVYLKGSHRIGSYNQWAFALHKPAYRFPKHLGYTGNETFQQAVGEETYAVTKTRDYYWWQGASESRLKKIIYYSRQDTRRLWEDPSTNRVYSNENFTVWLTEG